MAQFFNFKLMNYMPTSKIMISILIKYRDKVTKAPFIVLYILCTLSVMCIMLHINSYIILYAPVGGVVKFINAL